MGLLTSRALPLLAPAVLCLVGCPAGRVDFETNTRVAIDGSVSRSILYTGTDAGADELEKTYDLPGDGTWYTSSTVRFDAEGEQSSEWVRMYSFSRRFAAAEPIPSDHIRKGQVPGREARNEIAVSMRDFFFVRYYSYREVLRDEGGRRGTVTALERAYPRWVEALSKALEERLEGVSRENARAAVEAVAGPWRNRLVNGPPIEPEILQHAFELEEPLVGALFEALPPPPPAGQERWRAEIAAAIDASDDFLDEDEELMKGLFGVYDLQLFGTTTYRVKQRLAMPGTLLSTNATSRDGDLLVWELEPELLRFRDFASEARSRAVFPARIAGAGALVLALSAGVRRRFRRLARNA
jgi:hypothetical protein